LTCAEAGGVPGDMISDVAGDEVVGVVAGPAAEREGLANGFTGLLEGFRSELPTAQEFVVFTLVYEDFFEEGIWATSAHELSCVVLLALAGVAEVASKGLLPPRALRRVADWRESLHRSALLGLLCTLSAVSGLI
jgi:hypothetical protein